jgi:hypothetical protein
MRRLFTVASALSLSGNTSGTCPECGTAIPSSTTTPQAK